MLLGPRNDGRTIVKKDWKVLKQLWPTLVASKHSEKPSISVLFKKLTDTVAKLARTFQLEFSLPAETVTLAIQVLEPVQDPIGPGHDVTSDNVANYEGLQDHLCQLMATEGEGALHWRHQVSQFSQHCPTLIERIECIVCLNLRTWR